MQRFWMVRAGEGGRLVSEFEATNCVAIGWKEMGDISGIHSLDQLRQKYSQVYPQSHPSRAANAVAMIWKFKEEMAIGDDVVTYDPSQREYLVGKIASDYRDDQSVLTDYNQIRDVDWKGKVSRDDLTTSAKNTMGSTTDSQLPRGAAIVRLRSLRQHRRIHERSEIRSGTGICPPDTDRYRRTGFTGHRQLREFRH